MRPQRTLILAALFLFSWTMNAAPFGPPQTVTQASPAQVAIADTIEDTLVLWRVDSTVRVKASRSSNTAGSLVTEFAESADVAAIGDRGIAVWTQTSGAVMALRLKSDGAPAGPIVRIGDGAAGPIAVAANGESYLVSWIGTLDNVYVTLLNPAGGARVPPMPVTTPSPSPLGALASASNGEGFALVWHTSTPVNDVYALTLDDNAVPSTFAPVLVAAANARFPDVTSNGTNYFVVWGDADGIGGRTLTPQQEAGRSISVAAPDAAGPRVAWDGSAYSVAYVSLAQLTRPAFIHYMVAVRIRESGGFVERLLCSPSYFPRAFDLSARAGRVALAVSTGAGLTLEAAGVEQPKRRARSTRH